MLVRHVELGDLEAALATVNAVFSDNVKFRRCDRVSGSRGGGSTYRVTLTVHDSSAPGARRSVGHNPGRRISAACWHTYGCFFDSLPEQAVIVVSGSKPQRPGDPWVDRNIGSQMYPAWHSEACECSQLSLSIPLPQLFINDYGAPIVIVDSWAEHNRLERLINALQSDGMGDPGPVVVHLGDGEQLEFELSQVELYFSDSEQPCGNYCGRSIGITPDCYMWQLRGHRFMYGDLICDDCIKSDSDLGADYLLEHVNANKLIQPDLVNPADHGWACLDDDKYENGFHSGQSDDPNQQIGILNAAGIDCLFSGWVSQFDVSWVVWVPSDKLAAAVAILDAEYTGLPYDPGTEMAKALRGEHSDHYTMTTKTITQEQFIKGDYE